MKIYQYPLLLPPQACASCKVQVLSLNKELEPVQLAQAGGRGAVGVVDISPLGNVLSDTLDCLGDTVKSNAKDLQNSREIPKVKKPHFDGTGCQLYDDFEEFIKLFNDYTKNVVSKSKLLEFLRDCMSNTPYKLISAYPLEDDNYDLALDALYKVYSNIDECRIQLMNKKKKIGTKLILHHYIKNLLNGEFT